MLRRAWDVLLLNGWLKILCLDTDYISEAGGVIGSGAFGKLASESGQLPV